MKERTLQQNWAGSLRPSTPQSPPVDSIFAMKFSIDMTPIMCEADPGFAHITPVARRGGGYSPPPLGNVNSIQLLIFTHLQGPQELSDPWAYSLSSHPPQAPRLRIAGQLCVHNTLWTKTSSPHQPMKPSPWGVRIPICHIDNLTQGGMDTDRFSSNTRDRTLRFGQKGASITHDHKRRPDAFPSMCMHALWVDKTKGPTQSRVREGGFNDTSSTEAMYV